MAGSLTKAAMVAGLLALTVQSGVARAQAAGKISPTEMLEAMKSAPVSPNGRPMEAIWDRAPEASDGNTEDAKPYFVSRWGGIVVRGTYRHWNLDVVAGKARIRQPGFQQTS